MVRHQQKPRLFWYLKVAQRQHPQNTGMKKTLTTVMEEVLKSREEEGENRSVPRLRSAVVMIN
jgi:hypothetical protein